MTRRAARWKDFYSRLEKREAERFAPAFVQEIVVGLWSVQYLCRRPFPQFSWLHRQLSDPPSVLSYEPFYNGWPGDHRGWMRFESKEVARDFYKFATGLITFEEFQKLPHTPLSSVRIDLDDKGDFVSAGDRTGDPIGKR